MLSTGALQAGASANDPPHRPAPTWGLGARAAPAGHPLAGAVRESEQEASEGELYAVVASKKSREKALLPVMESLAETPDAVAAGRSARSVSASTQTLQGSTHGTNEQRV